MTFWLLFHFVYIPETYNLLILSFLTAFLLQILYFIEIIFKSLQSWLLPDSQTTSHTLLSSRSKFQAQTSFQSLNKQALTTSVPCTYRLFPLQGRFSSAPLWLTPSYSSDLSLNMAFLDHLSPNWPLLLYSITFDNWFHS